MIFIEITYGNSKVTVEVKCRFCNQLDYVKKHGKGSMQHQRYRCQQCNKTFQLDYIYHACRPGIKEQIIDLAMNNALKVLLICEVDKMWSFVRGKKLQSWLWYAWEPDLKCIIVHAFGDRSDTLNILLTHVWNYPKILYINLFRCVIVVSVWFNLSITHKYYEVNLMLNYWSF